MGRAWLVWGAGATLLILLAATALVALNRLDELPLPEREAAAAPASPGLIAQGEYLVRVGDQLLQVQTPHRNAFAQGETCYLKFPGIMWYGREDEQAEAERNRRQLV